jgi:predicted Zn-dependent peptidase
MQWIVGSLVLLVPLLSLTAAEAPRIETRTLTNGLRCTVISFPRSTNVSIFAYSPLSLCTDGAGQAQWSHLVEHLVVRSTIPQDSEKANAETLPDHMRLDFYGTLSDWKEGLSHHHRWLEGVPFTQSSLEAEKPKVIQECEFVSTNLATHKFAAAAWSQGFRHGRTNILLKGDVTRATLPEIQRLRDQRLAPSNQASLCVAGGVDPKIAFAEIEKQFSGLHFAGPPDLKTKTASGNLNLTWDIDASHFLLTWPVPDPRHVDFPALMIAAQCLNQVLFSDQSLRNQTGMLFAGMDLNIPEGTFFYVSASLRPGANSESLRQAVLNGLRQVASEAGPSTQARMIASGLSSQLLELPSPEAIRASAPPGSDPEMLEPRMIEMNLGLQFGMVDYRFGSFRPELARGTAAVTSADVRRVVNTWLTPAKSSTCSIRPAR